MTSFLFVPEDYPGLTIFPKIVRDLRDALKKSSKLQKMRLRKRIDIFVHFVKTDKMITRLIYKYKIIYNF